MNKMRIVTVKNTAPNMGLAKVGLSYQAENLYFL